MGSIRQRCLESTGKGRLLAQNCPAALLAFERVSWGVATRGLARRWIKYMLHASQPWGL